MKLYGLVEMTGDTGVLVNFSIMKTRGVKKVTAYVCVLLYIVPLSWVLVMLY